MKKMFLLATLLLTTTLAFAADRTQAYNTICKVLYSEATQMNCMQTVKKYSFYDDASLKICAAIYNDAGKITCLTNIGDKNFEGFEIDQCAKLYNDASKPKSFLKPSEPIIVTFQSQKITNAFPLTGLLSQKHSFYPPITTIFSLASQ